MNLNLTELAEKLDYDKRRYRDGGRPFMNSDLKGADLSYEKNPFLKKTGNEDLHDVRINNAFATTEERRGRMQDITKTETRGYIRRDADIMGDTITINVYGGNDMLTLAEQTAKEIERMKERRNAAGG